MDNIGDVKMEESEIIRLAGEAIDEYFMNIDNVVCDIVDKIIDKYGLDDDDISEDEKKYLKDNIMRGILKWDGDKK